MILIGEVRERETMDYAIAFAETGHLCLATLHANSTNQALDRIINFFPEERRAQLLMDLSLNVRAFVAQRLIPRRDGRGRVPAVEVMLNSPLISDLIFKGDVSGIKDIMKKSRELGMQTFDQSLFDLYEAGLISYEDALRNADSLNDLRLEIKLHGKEAKNRNVFAGIGNLDIVPERRATHNRSSAAVVAAAGVDAGRSHWRSASAACATLGSLHVLGCDASWPASTATHADSHRDQAAPGLARARARVRRRPHVPPAVRIPARVFAVGRSARPRPGPGNAAGRQARRDDHRRRARRPLRDPARRSPTATTPASIRGTTCTTSASARTSCGSATSTRLAAAGASRDAAARDDPESTMQR